jgi:hypothetical protein
MTTRKNLPAHEKGSGKIFADIGLPNAAEPSIKADLVLRIAVARRMGGAKAIPIYFRL